MSSSPSTTPGLDSLPTVIIGGGPVGLAAAAHLIDYKRPFTVLERGPNIAAAIREWGHVRLFSPWRYCLDGAAVRLLDEAGWTSPDLDALPTGNELVEKYLAPLASLPSVAANIRYNAEVVSVGRQGIDKVQSAGRGSRPFEIRLADGNAILASAVIDASGTWSQPNPMGAGGCVAAGESATGGLVYGLPDIEDSERSTYAGQRTLVVGSGHSAINNILSLLAVAQDAPGTTVTWALRRDSFDGVFGGEGQDALPARGALGSRARAAVGSGQLSVLAPFQVASVVAGADGLVVTGNQRDETISVTVDRVIVATGFRPNLEMLREVRLGIDPALESSSILGPLIDPNLHSCGTVPPHGARELAHPEQNFYVIGNKSYGRAPTFLLATGYEQARSVVAQLAGDFEAAARVELVLPETGVCSSDVSAGASCCGSEPSAVIGLEEIATASSCCGGPAPAASNACCALDAEAKAAGEEGCGCGSASQPALVGATA